MRLHAVAAVLALAGCIEPHLIPCGDLACVEGEQVCNLDDPEAPTCVPPANCGDRVIGYGEACDLDSLGGQTCESRGYYRGELSCTASCALEEVACAGRCGDGVLDVDNGELCDGFGGSCYDRGFDDGVMACSATCQPTTEACGRNGWRAVVQIDLPVSMAVAGGVVGVIDRPSAGAPMRTQIVRDGQAIAPPVANPTYAAVAAVRSTTAQPTAPALVFAAVDRIDRYDVTAGTWSSIAPPSGGFPVAVDDVYAHDHGGVLEVFVALADGTVMWNAGGTWSPPTDVLFVSGGLRFVPSPDGVPPLVWQGGSLVQWDPAVENFDYRVCNGESSTISAVAVDRANRIWSHNGTMVQVCTLEDLALHRVMSAVGGMFLRLAPSPDGVAVIGAGALREFTAVTSIDDCRNWECVSPSLGSQFMYDGDEPYAAVPNDAVRTLPVGAWRSMTTLQGSAFQAVEPDSVGHLLVRGIDIIAQPQLWMMSIDGWTPKGVRAYAGSRMHLEFTIQNSGLIYEGAILASTTDESAVFDLLWSRDDSPGLVDAHAIGTGVYAAWLKDQFYWEVRPLAFPITKLAGSHVDSLYGIAATTSSLYRFDGQTWSTYADLGATPVDLWVAPDDSAWVIASDRIIHVKPGAPPIVDTTMFAGHELLAISGSAVDDVVVGGVVDVENGFSGLLRYDGTVWYEVRTPEHVGRVFDIAITGRSRYFLTVDREDRTVIRLDSWLRP